MRCNNDPPAPSPAPPAPPAPSKGVDVFSNGEQGYACFRIPSLLRLPNGQVALFAEGRNGTCSDYAPTDIVRKTSGDGGMTWGELQVLVGKKHDRYNTFTATNPSPVVVDDKVLLVFNYGGKTATLRSSDPAGEKWPDAPVDVTKQLGRVVTPGPPQGVVLGDKTQHNHKGRIVIAAHWIEIDFETSEFSGSKSDSSALNINSASFSSSSSGSGSRSAYAHGYGSRDPFDPFVGSAMLSDDKGNSWRLSKNKVKGESEGQIAPAPNGSLLLNMRSISKDRAFSWSNDDGDSWSEAVSGPDIFPDLGGHCEGAMVRVPDTNYLVTSTPFNPTASCGVKHESARCNMTAWSSTDSGASWQLLALVGQNPLDGAGYSALLPLDNKNVAIVYERGPGDGRVEHLTWNKIALPSQ